MACPECKKDTLVENPEWEDAFDRLDSNYPSFDLIYKELKRRGIPHYRCSNCQHEVYE